MNDIEMLKELYDIMGVPYREDFGSEASDIFSGFSKVKKLIDIDMRIIALQTKLEIAYFEQRLLHPRKKPRKINRICRQIKALQEEIYNE